MTKQEADALVVSKAVQNGFEALRDAAAKPSARIVNDDAGTFAIKLGVDHGTRQPHPFEATVTDGWQAEQVLGTVLGALSQQKAAEVKPK